MDSTLERRRSIDSSVVAGEQLFTTNESCDTLQREAPVTRFTSGEQAVNDGVEPQPSRSSEEFVSKVLTYYKNLQKNKIFKNIYFSENL